MAFRFIRRTWNEFSEYSKAGFICAGLATGLYLAFVPNEVILPQFVRELVQPTLNQNLVHDVAQNFEKEFVHVAKKSKATNKRERAITLAKLAAIESSPPGNIHSRHPDGALGLMQIMRTSGHGKEAPDFAEFSEPCTLYNGHCYVTIVDANGDIYVQDGTPIDHRESRYIAIAGGNEIYQEKADYLRQFFPKEDGEIDEKLLEAVSVIAYNVGQDTLEAAIKAAETDGNFNLEGIRNHLTLDLVRTHLGRKLGNDETKIRNRHQAAQGYFQRFEQVDPTLRTYFEEHYDPDLNPLSSNLQI